MSEEQVEQTEETSDVPEVLAPGLSDGIGSSEEQQEPGRRGPDPLAGLRTWQPRTRLGRMIYERQIHTYEQAISSGLPIREVEIVDALLPDLTDDVLAVNMIQRMTGSGRRVRFQCPLRRRQL